MAATTQKKGSKSQGSRAQGCKAQGCKTRQQDKAARQGSKTRQQDKLKRQGSKAQAPLIAIHAINGAALNSSLRVCLSLKVFVKCSANYAKLRLPVASTVSGLRVLFMHSAKF
jgi:hypothetical protein